MTTSEATSAAATPDPRAHELGTDRWLTDARVYNLLWLGRWIRAGLRLGARSAVDGAARIRTASWGDVDLLLQIAAEVRGVSVGEESSRCRRC